MTRRELLRASAVAALCHASPSIVLAATGTRLPRTRIRPGDAGWPSAQAWDDLNRAVGGRLLKVSSPLTAYRNGSPTRIPELFAAVRNPYYVGDEPGLTQTLGWAGHWKTEASCYAVVAESASDVAAAIDFARTRNLRLVVKGGGHSYQGTSNAPDSLLVWTRRMTSVVMHDAFVGQGCVGRQAPQPAVTIGAGALWSHAYDIVTTKGGRYVQGGGCMTVGVAGLIQSGGFGSFSKGFGLASAGLIEAEIVTADGAVLTVNDCRHPDLFWALKGGGGGTFGIVTKLTLKTHDLPEFFGVVNIRMKARTDDAFRALIAAATTFYAETLMNPHWGEQMKFTPDNVLSVEMTFQGIDQDQAHRTWAPFLSWLSARSNDYTVSTPIILAAPARHFWDPAFLKSIPGLVKVDDRPGSRGDNIFWSGDAGQAGWFLHGMASIWLSRQLLAEGRHPSLVVAMFEASRKTEVALHFNKGLAGAPPEAIEAARRTAVNPMVCEAFALAICAESEGPAYPGVIGHEPDDREAAAGSAAVAAVIAALRKVEPAGGSYLSESDYADRDWRAAYWGSNAGRLEQVKRRHDPDGLFFVHHGVASERWATDGFAAAAPI